MRQIHLAFVSDNKKIGYILDLDKDKFFVGTVEGELIIPKPHREGKISNPQEVSEQVINQIQAAVRSYVAAESKRKD